MKLSSSRRRAKTGQATVPLTIHNCESSKIFSILFSSLPHRYFSILFLYVSVSLGSGILVGEFLSPVLPEFSTPLGYRLHSHPPRCIPNSLFHGHSDRIHPDRKFSNSYCFQSDFFQIFLMSCSLIFAPQPSSRLSLGLSS